MGAGVFVIVLNGEGRRLSVRVRVGGGRTENQCRGWETVSVRVRVRIVRVMVGVDGCAVA